MWCPRDEDVTQLLPESRSEYDPFGEDHIQNVLPDRGTLTEADVGQPAGQLKQD